MLQYIIVLNYGVFVKVYSKQIDLCDLFYQMKILEIQERTQDCWSVDRKELQGQNMDTFMLYLQFFYREVSYLNEIEKFNHQQEQKIVDITKTLRLKQLNFQLPKMVMVKRLKENLGELEEEIKEIFLKANQRAFTGSINPQKIQKIRKEAKQKLWRITNPNSEFEYCTFFGFGFWVGCSFIFLVLVLGIAVTEELKIDDDSQFANFFPIWRGAGLFILYLWVYGFTIYIFQKYRITYRLILKFEDHEFSSSAKLLCSTSVITVVYLLAILVYLLSYTKKIGFEGGFFRKEMLPAFVWVLLFPVIFFGCQSKIQTLKMFFRTLLSPLPFREVNFPAIFMAEQFISISIPLKDFSYTMCFYKNTLEGSSPFENCNTGQFSLSILPIVIVLSFRFFQSFKLWKKNGRFFSIYCLASIKPLTKLTIILLSFQDVNFSVWFVASIFQAIFIELWDVNQDWGLFENNCRNFLLRKCLVFHKIVYYVIILFNLVFSFSWLLSVSPNFVDFFVGKNLAILVIGVIEALRRGAWNILKIQNQHIKNCIDFRVTPEAQQFMFNNATIDQQIELDQVKNRKKFLQLIYKKIEERQKGESEMEEIFSNSQEKMLEIKKKLKIVSRNYSKLLVKQTQAQF